MLTALSTGADALSLRARPLPCRTCEEALEAAAAAGDVTLQESALAGAAAALPLPATILQACQFMRLPIRFDSLQSEVRPEVRAALGQYINCHDRPTFRLSHGVGASLLRWCSRLQRPLLPPANFARAPAD